MTDTTHDQDHRTELDAERAVNEQHLAEIERLLDKQPHLVKQIAVVQSQQWTTSSLPRPGIDRGATAAVIGRVALEDGHPYSDMMDQTFYVAGWHVEKDGFETVNWAAPIASLYFEGRSSGYPIASAVTGRRTFVLRLAELDEPPRIEPFVAETAREVETRMKHLRAADAVVKVMRMPKQGRMGAVLPTMQPDQYLLVAVAGRDPGPQSSSPAAQSRRAPVLSEAGTHRTDRIVLGTRQELAVDLEMTDDTGHCDIHVLQMGYRSTQQILRFANQLLPRGERGEQALRNGPQPTITRVSADGRTAAVVVEPRDFPENVGRQGVLYTSLTRANKELAVVHAQPLPRGLRPPR